MSLANFYEYFSPAYQEIFQKVVVGKDSIANMRFDSSIKRKGDTVHRFAMNIDAVRVRDITDPYADRTIDALSDSDETLTINYNKSANFQLSSKTKLQAGDLNPMAYAGAKLAQKVALAVDADILYETVNMTYDFDNGDLTTMVSDGASIALSTTTVPQMAHQLFPKLAYRNQQNNMNLCFIADTYSLGKIAQYLGGKETEYSISFLENGIAKGRNFGGAQVYCSEKLTAEAVLGMATNPTAGDTIVINGITITFRATLTTASGSAEVHIASTVDITRANLAEFLNDPSASEAEATDTGYSSLSSANLETWYQMFDSGVVATNNNTTNKLTLVARGAGRLILSETFTDATDAWDKNFIHAYYGKKGAVDVVMQEGVDSWTREEPKKRVTNVFVEALYGIKTFADGKKKGLDVLITA